MEKFEFLRLLSSLSDILDEDNSIRDYFLTVCGIDLENYYKNREILTQRILEHHLDELVDRIENMRRNLGKYSEYGELMFFEDDAICMYYILTILIFETGSAFPNRVKYELLLKRDNWLKDLEPLDDFRQTIINYLSGKPLIKDLIEFEDRMNQEVFAEWSNKDICKE